MAKHKFYKKKAIVSGNQIEYREYEFPIVYRLESNQQGGRKAGLPGHSERSTEYRKRSGNKAKYDLMRLINTNFTRSKMRRASDSYKFITLTFRDEAIPDLTDVKMANIELKKYVRKLRGICKKEGREIKYVAVVEFQDENGRGAVHFHMIADIPVIPVTRELAEKWKREGVLPQEYNVKINHYDLWGLGSVTVKAIIESEKYGETSSKIETTDIGQYVAGYMVKDFGDWRLKGNKAYSPSHGLIKPEVVYDTEADQAIEGLGKENVVCEDSYPDTYHNTSIHYVKFKKSR